jgi:hypothetical protein
MDAVVSYTPDDDASRRKSSAAGKVSGAGDRPRTGYLNLGKVALYQVSYARAAGIKS